MNTTTKTLSMHARLFLRDAGFARGRDREAILARAQRIAEADGNEYITLSDVRKAVWQHVTRPHERRSRR
jgi:hypothetical protein